MCLGVLATMALTISFLTLSSRNFSLRARPDPVVRESCAQVNSPETDPDGVLEGALDDVLDWFNDDVGDAGCMLASSSVSFSVLVSCSLSSLGGRSFQGSTYSSTRLPAFGSSCIFPLVQILTHPSLPSNATPVSLILTSFAL